MPRRDRPDHYSLQARREGFAARSVYKLKEIQQKQRLLKSGFHVLDIGAAPGSWTQFARSIVGREGHVVAVDLSPLPELEDLAGVTTVVGDIYDREVTDRVAGAGPYDAVISDAAPRTTGNRSVDTARSAAIVEHILALCGSLLKPGGNLVCKLFQGGDEQAILAAARVSFRSARLVKPRASRSESFEVFVTAAGYTGQE